MKSSSLIIFFDFNCGLCNKIICYLQKLDKNKKFLFAPINGVTWKKLCISPTKDSVLVKKGEILYWEFQAVQIILQNLNFPWTILGYISHIVPTFVGTFFYKQIAQRRKKISCVLTTPIKIPQDQILPTILLSQFLHLGLLYSNFLLT